MSGDVLYSIMKGIAQNATPATNLTDIVYGLVKSIEPLQIFVENKFDIDEDQLILSPFCKRKVITTEQITQDTHSHNIISLQQQPAGDPSHTHMLASGKVSNEIALITEIELWRGLQEGDNVIMLRISQGQAYYVLERVEITESQAEGVTL